MVVRIAIQRVVGHLKETTGDVEPDPFVVPAGTRLVITDVSWTAGRHPNAAFVAGEIVNFRLRAHATNGDFFNNKCLLKWRIARPSVGRDALIAK